MNKRDLKKFEKILLEERKRIVAELTQLEEESLGENQGPYGQDVASFAEVGTDNNERETALRVASTEADMLREIDDALQRIKDGTYGTCEGTGKPIPKKRLEVFPWARYCVEYQEELERSGHSGYGR